jgi:hypothetical protein
MTKIRNIRVGFSITAVLILAGGLNACSPPQDPWVSDTQQLKQERYLSPDQERLLRERVNLSQRDR